MKPAAELFSESSAERWWRRDYARRCIWAFFTIVLWISSLSVPDSVASTELDLSWQQALHQAFAEQWQCGTDYVFTYGPLGFLATQVYDSRTFLIRMSWSVVFATVSAGLALYVLVKLPGIVLKGLFWGLWTIWGLAATEAKYTAVLAIPVLLLLRHSRPGATWILLTVTWLAVLANIKFTFTITGSVLGVLLLIHLCYARGWRMAGIAAGWGLAGFIIIWMACGQSLENLPSYIQNSVELARGYAEGMAKEGSYSELMLALMLLLFISLAGWWEAALRSSWRRGLVQAIAIGWLALQAFKYGFVRQDAEHSRVFFWTVAALGCVLWPSWEDMKSVKCHSADRLRLVLGVTLLASYLALAPLTAHGWPILNTWLTNMVRNTHAICNWRTYQHMLEAKRQAITCQHQLPMITKFVGNAAVDLFTVRQGVLLLNGLRWQPRPIWQSYAALTPTLLRMNRDFFCRGDASEFVIVYWEPNDYWESADSGALRLPTQDDGSALLELMDRYTPVCTENGYLLLRRRTQQITQHKRPVLFESDIHRDEFLDLASLGSQGKAMELRIQYTWLGRMRLLLFRGLPLFLEVEFDNGPAARLRIYPGLLRQSVLIDPLPLEQREMNRWFLEKQGRRVHRIRVVADNSMRVYLQETIHCRILGLASQP